MRVCFFLSLLLMAARISTLSSYEFISGIYVHIPFCRRRCYYCDFPIKVVGESKTIQTTASQQYTNSLLKEISVTSQFMNKRFMKDDKVKIDSIYFGGGTPSLLENNCKIVATILCNCFSSHEFDLRYKSYHFDSSKTFFCVK